MQEKERLGDATIGSWMSGIPCFGVGNKTSQNLRCRKSVLDRFRMDKINIYWWKNTGG